MTTIEALTDIEKEIKWQTPTPIVLKEEALLPYPTGALPSIVGNAVTDYQQYGQQPLPLIACSALANISLSCQTLANVARDKFLVSPVSLYFLVIAGSGERKSAADYTFSKAIRQWQINARQEIEPEVKVAQTLHEAWQFKKEGVLNMIRRSTLSASESEMLHDRLLDLMENEPRVPLLPVLFFEDATQEALASHMASGWPSSSLWSDEGGIVVGGHGMQSNSTKFVALLNRLWDGNAFIAHRKSSKSFTVANRRLTVSLMMQPLILEQMLIRGDGISRQSGFLARSLICQPLSAMGNRFYQEPPTEISSLEKFHQRLVDCLNTSLTLDKNGCHDLPSLHLSSNAKNIWVDFFNSIESGLKNPMQWQSIKDFASKSAENVARLATLFHLFEGKSGEITVENIERASEIIKWHLLEAKSILGHHPQTAAQFDAYKLLQWITSRGLPKTNPRHLQQYGPIREKEQRNNAIKILIENQFIKEIKQKGKTTLLINPKIYHN